MTPKDLKSLRAALGLSQREVAEALAVTRHTINRWEMGMHPIPPMAVKLLRALVTQTAPAPAEGRRRR